MSTTPATTAYKRRLGRSGIEVSAIGLGCWAIGGPNDVDTGEALLPMGWGAVDDAESTRAIHRALDLGVTFFDTASNYGIGHSESVLGAALGTRRPSVVVATKFATMVDESRWVALGRVTMPPTEEAVRGFLEGSLRRLGTDYIDLYQLHAGQYDPDDAVVVRDILELLVAEGKIRCYGWSTDDPNRARIFAQGAHCATVQHQLNAIFDAPEMLAVCDEFDLASINKDPLRSGQLTGKFRPDSRFPEDDGRRSWDLTSEPGAARLAQVEALRPVFTRDGRTMAQGALAWILGRSPRSIPIPGFKSVTQVEDNAAVLRLEPMNQDDVAEVARLMGRA